MSSPPEWFDSFPVLAGAARVRSGHRDRALALTSCLGLT